MRPKVTLYCKEGGSDKQYTIWIEERGDGLHSVETQNGPRGGWVKSGSKTPEPVSLDAAEKVYDKTIKAKKANGYTEGDDAPAFSQTQGATDSGLRPMLLTDCSEEGPERFIESDEWGGQEKMNGKRILIRVESRIIGVNRRGLECPIPQAITGSIGHLPGLVLDGELIGETYHAFDALGIGARGSTYDIRQKGAHERHLLMCEQLLNVKGGYVKIVHLVRDRNGKRRLVNNLIAGRREGVVFKMLAATYEAGRIENIAKAIAVKCKFYAEGTFVALGWNDKSSIRIAATPDDGTSLIAVGNVTVPKKYVAQINEAMKKKRKRALIRVRYLYATPSYILYQPNLDPDDTGCVVRDDTDQVTRRMELKLEGKDDE